jgi:hypothetical protein
MTSWRCPVCGKFCRLAFGRISNINDGLVVKTCTLIQRCASVSVACLIGGTVLIVCLENVLKYLPMPVIAKPLTGLRPCIAYK